MNSPQTIDPMHDAIPEDSKLSPIEEERLEIAVVRQLNQYFEQLNGAQPHPLHPLVMNAVERPLLDYVMQRCHQNQCKAARLLGINRNTLRKKLLIYGLIKE